MRFSTTLLVAMAAFALLAACPIPPLPPTPPPPPPVQAVVTLVGGELFVDDKPLAGEQPCCDDPTDPADASDVTSYTVGYAGWPLRSTQYIDDLRSGGKRNASEFRPGPYRPGSEGTHGLPGGFDIIPVAAERTRYANANGIVVLHSLIDGWDTSFFGASCDVLAQGPPTPAVLDWVTRYVQATKGPGSFYHTGNEVGKKCRPSDAWNRGVYAAAKAAGAGLVGVSIDPFKDSAIGPFVGDFVTVQDYWLTMHRADLPPGIPAITTEHDGSWHTEEHYLDAETVADRGSYIWRWKGQVSRAVWEHIIGIGPEPGPICADKTAIRSIGLQVYSRKVGATPKDQFGQPYGEENPTGWVKRGRCEMEKGFPYIWTLDGRRCADYPSQGYTCWLVGGNPLELSQPHGRVGICPRDSDGNNCGYLVVP